MKTPTKWLENALSELRLLDHEERRIGVKVLELLWEIERRKAYSELGYDGLYSFCVKELKYSESQAFQRVQAMRALKSNPEIESEMKNKIESGAMSLTTVAQVQVFFRQDHAKGIRRNAAEKLELFNQFDHKTSNEVKKTIAELKGEHIYSKLTIELDEEAEIMWKEVRAFSAHQTRGDELLSFKLLMKEWLAQKTAQLNSRRDFSGLTKPVKKPPALQSFKNSVKSLETPSFVQHSPASQHSPSNRHVPSHVRAQINLRDQSKCTGCGSKYAIQIEHIIPHAKGGTHHPDNLKLLCRNCNLHQGVKEFGLEKMKR